MFSTTRGNKYKLQKNTSHYNLRKFSFSSRIVNRPICNSLPDTVVDADKINTFKSRLDKHWCQDPPRFGCVRCAIAVY